jgi:hypothetical protein
MLLVSLDCNNLKSPITNVSEHSKDKPIILAGDFNLLHIDWENNTVKTGSNQVNHHQELIEIVEDLFSTVEVVNLSCNAINTPPPFLFLSFRKTF